MSTLPKPCSESQRVRNEDQVRIGKAAVQQEREAAAYDAAGVRLQVRIAQGGVGAGRPPNFHGQDVERPQQLSAVEDRVHRGDAAAAGLVVADHRLAFRNTVDEIGDCYHRDQRSAGGGPAAANIPRGHARPHVPKLHMQTLRETMPQQAGQPQWMAEPSSISVQAS